MNPRALTAVRRALHARRRAAHQAAKSQRRIGRVRTAVRKALARLDRWSRVPDRWGAVRHGLERIHRDTRRAWKHALADPQVENMHEWRKRAKNLRYTVELLEPIWPEVIQAFAREVERLESDLGEDHDLAMLPAHVTGDSVRPNGHDRDLVIALVDVRRRELQTRARRTAARVCRERPGAFSVRLGTYWKAWRREAAVRDCTPTSAFYARTCAPSSSPPSSSSQRRPSPHRPMPAR